MHQLHKWENLRKETREKLMNIFDILQERLSWEESVISGYKEFIDQYSTVYFFMKDKEAGIKCVKPLLDILQDKEVCFIDMNSKNHGKEIFAGIYCYGLERMFGSDWHTSVIVISELEGLKELEKIINEECNQTIDKLKHAAICKNYAGYVLKTDEESCNLSEIKGQDRNIRHYIALKDSIFETFDALHDDFSCYILYRIVATRFFVNDYTNANMVDIFTSNLNFPREICEKLTENEVLIDVGAYPGNVTVDFIHHTRNQFKKVYMLELDKENYLYMKSQEEFGDERIDIFNQGVAEKNYMTTYIQRGNFHSEIIDNSSPEILKESRVEKCKIKTLDSMREEEIKERVTYMAINVPNIINVLKGAEKIIKEDSPKLAIRVNDHRLTICNVVLYLKSIMPEYQFFIRHHSDVFKRTVLYAIRE